MCTICYMLHAINPLSKNLDSVFIQLGVRSQHSKFILLVRLYINFSSGINMVSLSLSLSLPLSLSVCVWRGDLSIVLMYSLVVCVYCISLCRWNYALKCVNHIQNKWNWFELHGQA